MIIIDSMNTPARSPRKSRGFDSLEQQVFLNLWRTYDRLRAFEDDLFGRHDLTPQQYNALRLLSSAHPDKLTTLGLAGRLVSHAPDITRLLDKLEQRGLIARDRPAHNRRVVRIGITAAGLALLRALHKPLQECHAGQLGHLSPRQLKQLSLLLHAARRPHEEEGSSWR
jgi:DNA-binding MarR family transcriptional regulator